MFRRIVLAVVCSCALVACSGEGGECGADPGLCEPSDPAGCERVIALQANPVLGEQTRPWVAVDLSECGPAPRPRRVYMEQDGAEACAADLVAPTGGSECATVDLLGCAELAEEGWEIRIEVAGEIGAVVDYVELASPDYGPGDALACGLVGGEWSCSGLPQAASCDPMI